MADHRGRGVKGRVRKYQYVLIINSGEMTGYIAATSQEFETCLNRKAANHTICELSTGHEPKPKIGEYLPDWRHFKWKKIDA